MTLWNYQCQIRRVVDGDTLDLRIDCGFHVDRRERVRLDGVDTAETYGVPHDSEEYERGVEHTRFVEEWVDEARVNSDSERPFLVRTEQRDTGKYGRYVAEIERKSDGELLTDALVEAFPEVEDA